MEEAVVGEQGVDEVAALLELGEFAHPSEVRGALDVEVLLGGPTEHEGEHDLHEELGLEVGLGPGSAPRAMPPPRPFPVSVIV